jgi:hypothetical protein
MRAYIRLPVFYNAQTRSCIVKAFGSQQITENLSAGVPLDQGR